MKAESALLEAKPVTATATEADWLRFLHSFALADHLGDASDDVRAFAVLAGLPMPPEDADFEGWLAWCEERGVTDGVHAEIERRFPPPKINTTTD